MGAVSLFNDLQYVKNMTVYKVDLEVCTSCCAYLAPLNQASDCNEAQAKVPAEVEEEIVQIDRGQDRYRIKRVDPYHRSLKGTIMI